MNITINGEKKTFIEPTSILGLLKILNIDTKKIAIELNLEIVPKSNYAETFLKNEDTLEIIQFIGGG
jgi:thiamine biosynthesis protein ThiS